jgi:hypothetical protein
MTHLEQWYQVSFDDRAVYRNVAPPGSQPWSDACTWEKIVRVCFRTGSLFESDEVYIFSSEREESYLIPTEAGGGRELVDELMRRGLFPAELMLEAMATEGQLFCWPDTALR